MPCNAIYGNYTESSFDGLPNDVRYGSILQPLLAMIQHKLKGNYLYAEEYLIKFLQQNRQNITTEDILDLSRHMSTCVCHLYIILVMMLLSVIIGFPLACCLKICYKKIANPKKHQYWFFTQAVVFVIAIAFLLIGCVSSWDVGLKMQTYLERFPKECIDVVNALNRAKIEFNSNYEKLHIAVDISLFKISNLTYEINDDVSDMLDRRIAVEYSLFLGKFDKLVDNMKEVFNILAFTNTTGKPESHFVTLCNDVNHINKEISRRLSDLKENNGSNQSTFLDVEFPGIYVKIDWQELYSSMIMLLDILFPQMNETVYFADMLKGRMKKIHDKNMDNVLRQIKYIQNLSESRSASMSKAIRFLSLERLEYAVSNISTRIAHLTSHSMSSRNNSSDFLKLTTWVFLFPSLYGFLVFIFFIVGFIGTCREIQGVTNGKIFTGFWTITFFKIAIRISVTFLWFMLLVTAALYIVHIPTVVVCGTIEKDKITDRYLDRPYWRNQTWMTSQLNEYFPKLGSPVTMKNLLKECDQNKTLFTCLNLEKYITSIYPSKLDKLIMKSIDKFSKVITNQSFTDFHRAIHRINRINYEMNMDYILQTRSNLRQIENGLGNARKVVDESLNERVGRAEELLGEINDSLGEFVEAKFLVHVAKEEANELQFLNDHLENITKDDVLSEINKYLNDYTDHIKCLHEETELFIHQSLLHDFGKCNFLPYSYNKLKWLICNYGLDLINSFWLSLAILSFSIAVAMILACRLACYVRGSYKISSNYLLNCQRYSSRRDIPDHCALPPEQEEIKLSK